MRNYHFHVPPVATELQVQDKDEKLLFTICRGKSVIYLDVVMADGSRKEKLSVDEIIDLMPETTTEDLKSFAGFIYLFGRWW
jgi:Mg/Co/Ni transporter MgtE